MGAGHKTQERRKKTYPSCTIFILPHPAIYYFFRNFAALNTRRLAALIANKVTLFIRLHNLCRP